MIAGITMLLAKIVGLAEWFGRLFVAVFEALWDMVTDVFCWVFDGMLGIAVDALAAIDTSAISGWSAAWSSFPAEVLNILHLLGVGTAMGIIAAAITIRFTLQLIPFVRLGS